MEVKDFEAMLIEMFGLLKKLEEKIDGILKELAENEKEHNKLIERMENFSLKKDVDTLAERIRTAENKITTLENLPTKKKAKFLDDIGKKILYFFIGAVGLFLISQLPNFILFISKIANK